jgi:hypothetical protein
METTLVDFVKVLRTADIQVSPAETLDAMEALELVGYRDRTLLKNSLSMILSKTPEEKELFETSFEKFFTFENISDQPWTEEGDHQDDNTDFDDSERDNPGNGQPGGKGSGQGGGQGSGEAEAEDDDNTTHLTPSSALGQLLMSGNRTELMISMSEAGRAVEVNQIVVFTQKGLYTRKIMDAMGLKPLQEEITQLQSDGGRPERNLAKKLKQGRDRLRDEVRDYVEKQFFLHADESGKKLREELLKKV